MALDKNDLAKEVTKKLTTNYTLEPEFVGDIEKLLVEVFAHYYVYKTPMDAGGKNGKKKPVVDDGTPKKPRPKNAYHMFVGSVLKTLTDVPSKERMKKVAEMWNAMDESAQAPYQKMADDANIALGLGVSVPKAKKSPKKPTASATTVSAPAVESPKSEPAPVPTPTPTPVVSETSTATATESETAPAKASKAKVVKAKK